MEEEIILRDDDDWFWHCYEINADHRQKFKHEGQPKKYPCKVKSEYRYENDSADWYSHEFKYYVEKKCSECGHIILVWSEEWE